MSETTERLLLLARLHLTDKQFNVLEMYHRERMSTLEIAKRLDINAASVRKLRGRAMDTLRDVR